MIQTLLKKEARKRAVFEIIVEKKIAMEKGYSERMASMQILEARVQSRDRLFERGNTRTSESKLTFNIAYCRAFQNVRSIL